MTYLFGLAADPLTKGHIDIIKNVIKRLDVEDNLDILVSNTDEKIYRACAIDRMNIVTTAVNSITKDKKDCPLVHVKEQPCRMYQYIVHNYEDTEELCLVIGEDEWNSLIMREWVNSQLLMRRCSFLIFRRKDASKDRVLSARWKYTYMDVDVAVTASSDVREILFRDPDCHYDKVRGLITHQVFREIKAKGLYYQNKLTYKADMAEYLEQYKKMKEENHWGEPSVTTDIVAYNGDRILLIRRGNYPYKNYWALPGGFMEKTDPDLHYGAQRELAEETGIILDPNDFEQIKTYGHDFDPRMKIVDVAFSVRVPKGKMDDAKGADDAAEARWFNINDLPKLAFHHADIINDWVNKTGRWDD